jgi:hypothetical protein
MLQASLEQAMARRLRYVTPGGALTHVSTYLGSNKMEWLAQGLAAPSAQSLAGQPMAYLVEQAPGATVDAHFHAVDQFQVFVAGSGRIGTHTVRALTVHYAGAFSPYGPIAAGEQGLSYVTLRRDWDPGAQWMPAAAPVLRALPERRHVAYTTEPMDLDALAGGSAQGVQWRELAVTGHAGSARWCGAAAGQDLLADPSGSAGQFWYVLAGSLVDAQGRQQQRGGCLFMAADQPPEPVRAGEEGAQFLQLRFAPS